MTNMSVDTRFCGFQIKLNINKVNKYFIRDLKFINCPVIHEILYTKLNVQRMNMPSQHVNGHTANFITINSPHYRKSLSSHVTFHVTFIVTQPVLKYNVSNYRHIIMSLLSVHDNMQFPLLANTSHYWLSSIFQVNIMGWGFVQKCIWIIHCNLLTIPRIKYIINN